MVPVPVRCHIPNLLRRIGHNQQWLADITGISKSRISEYVNLRVENMTLKRAKLIAYHLRCTVEDLYSWECREQE